MEGKSLIMSALLLSLVLGQIQVEAKSCCPSTTARNIYNICRAAGGSRDTCAKAAGCKIQDPPCPQGWNQDILQNTGVTEYCKLGCSSSACGAIITLQKSGESEVVSAAVEKCTQACSAFCTKAPIIAVEIA